MNLIDKDALMRTLGITDMDCDKCAWCDKEWSRCKRGSDFEDACCAIENAPTIEERKVGKWIVYKAPDKYHCGLCKCPFCGEEMIAESDEYNFCPNCGADMR